MAPTILEDISESPSALAHLSAWKFLAFGGGPISKRAGDILSQHTKIYCMLGSTETKLLPEFDDKAAEDWEYHAFHSGLGLDFRHHADGLYEMIIVKDVDNPFQIVFQTFPDITEYAMKDVYAKHPTKPGLWLYKGRVDDMIILSNGEKLQPNEAESIANSFEAVTTALICGQDRFQPALIIESRRGSVEVDCLEDILQNVNEVLPSFAQIDIDHVTVVPEDKMPLPRSAKGVVQRAKAFQQLQPDIEKLYTDARSGQSNQRSNTSPLDYETEESLISSLTTVVHWVSSKFHHISADDNFLNSGLDSLLALKMTRALRQTSEKNESAVEINSRLIYNNPTIRRLAKALLTSRLPNSHDDEVSDIEEMKQALEKSTQDLPQAPARAKDKSFSAGYCVLVTGSTGSLGAYLVDRLIRSPDVGEVICLNRGHDARARQAARNEAWGLSTDFSRVTFTCVDLTDPQFGLNRNTYERLAARATHIIHNAWPVSFAHPFDYFKPQLQGCRHLINFSAACTHRVPISFISSIGGANRYLEITGSKMVPEEMMSDFRVAEQMGYAQSKLVAEHMFARAARKSKVPCKICRVGQIAGPVCLAEDDTRGGWNRSEWFPSLIDACARLGCIPQSLEGVDVIDWIPVDILAKALIEAQLLDGAEDEIEVTHFVNPCSTTWAALLPSLRQILPVEARVIDYQSWLTVLRDSATSEHRDADDGSSSPHSEAQDANNRALILLPFFESLLSSERPGWLTKKARARSPTLSCVQSVNPTWMRKWMKQWGY